MINTSLFALQRVKLLPRNRSPSHADNQVSKILQNKWEIIHSRVDKISSHVTWDQRRAVTAAVLLVFLDGFNIQKNAVNN